MFHFLNKLEFELECSSEEQAFEIRHTFSGSNQEQIRDIIDNVCSKYAGENDWIRIDRLEIDLGDFSFESFEHEFSQAFIKKFDAIVSEKISQISGKGLAELRFTSDLELIENFLLKGRLPWWGDEDAVDIDEICRNVFKNRRTEIADFFMKNYNNNDVWERAAYQLNVDSLVVIVKLFRELHEAYNILEDLFKTDREKIISIAEQELQGNELEQVRENFVKIIVFSAPLLFSEAGKPQKIKSILINLLKKELISYISNLYPAKVTEFDKELSPEGDSKPVLKEIEIMQFPYVNKTDQEEKLIVRNAGIILLSPYLKKFFTNTGLLNDNSWLSKEAQQRGLFLLKYLSSGITKNFEYRLILEKLLCGIAIEEPVPLEILLNDNEINESEQLLKSVIEHWKALKNTSIQGLRETFFKRDGILVKKENDWILQIERKTVDILLESIPWGFSNVRLPWNEYLIVTEW